MPEWTSEQKKAIESRDGTILVSAAAGSGKTAVLVERVIRRLSDEGKPCPADRLLIVTFTRSATHEMRERIYRALSDKLAENPGSSYLRRQLSLLPFAKISTIDSFCSELVKDNFHALSISPDCKLLEGAELKIMQNDALTETLNELYSEKSPEFTALADLLVNGSDDSMLGELIKTLYDKSTAFTLPDEWLDSLIYDYSDSRPLKEGRWGRLILDELCMATEYYGNIADKMLSKAAEDEVVLEKYGPCVRNIKSLLEELGKTAREKDWDEVCAAFASVKLPNLGRLPKGYESEQADYIKAKKKNVADGLGSVGKLLCASESENDEDMKRLKPIAEKLIYSVKLYGAKLDEIKHRADGMDFADITHYALKLLVNFEDGKPVKTKLAEELSSQYEEILVDEYQDVNEIQNMLFTAVSRNGENLFTVGDVKQSIYRFRQAMPEIFLKKRNALEDYVDGNYPAKITLDRNFRSREKVTENINFVFRRLMSEETGGVDYGESEALIAAAKYPECDFSGAELHLLHSDGLITRADEAAYVAEFIEKSVGKIQVTQKGEMRPASYRDFCILMRSVSNGKAQTYAQALAERNIPVYVSESTGFFAAPEVSCAINLMRVTDNPIQDIPLLAVMMSPMFGFTADELAKMRIADRKAPLYHCVVGYAKSGDEKSRDFLEKLDRLRMLSLTLPCAEFLREAYEETGYRAIVAAMKNSESRISNLNVLTDFAEKYESSGRRGLSGFIRFIDKIQKQNGDLESASEASEDADVVRIMTIHKSKGLEFPVCIVADLSAQFSKNTNPFAFNPDYGICFDVKDNKLKHRYSTVGKKAIDLAENNASISEEMRILYVALTRAKEKLVCVTRCTNPEKKLSELVSGIEPGKPLPSYLIRTRNSMAEWVWLAFMSHPDAHALRRLAGADDKIVVSSAERLDVICAEPTEREAAESQNETVKCEENSGLADIIKERLAYEYPYAELSGIAAKSAPSDFEADAFSTKYFAAAKPRFLSKSGMSPANRGTATHKFMEFFDYSEPDFDVEKQAERMVTENRLTEEEKAALEIPKLERFFGCELAERIKRSDMLLREEKVTVGIPAAELYDGLSAESGGETVVVQGYVDCAFLEDGELVIVDYKTDRVSSAVELREKYAAQLKLYERALAECTGIKVRETLIYSFQTGEFVRL